MVSQTLLSGLPIARRTLTVVQFSRRAHQTQLPVFNRSARDRQVTGEIGQPLGFGSLANREAVLEVVRRNRLIVEHDSDRYGAARPIIQGNSIENSVRAGGSCFVYVLRIAFGVSVRTGMFGVGSVGPP